MGSLSSNSSPAETPASGGNFPTTKWTLIRAARSEDPESREKAIEHICQHYWYPIYAFLRRSGYDVSDAEDYTQRLFQELVERDSVRFLEQEKGKLRSYLLACLNHLLIDDVRSRSAQKRGGGQEALSLDGMGAEERYRSEPRDTRDPEWLYTHAWACDLITVVREKLRESFAISGRSDVFETLLPFLMWDHEPPSHREIAVKLGKSETASRLLVMRLRERFRSLLKDELAHTVLTEGEIAEEMVWLRSALERRQG